MQELRVYGGLDFGHLFGGEIWRLVTAQIVHVKQAHMMFNVACLALLGISLEPVIGRINILVLWFLSGSLGLLVSVYFGQYPFEVGTGASQAVLGFAGANCVLIYRGFARNIWVVAVVMVTLGVSLLLDINAAHYPKGGHIVGFFSGLIFGYVVLPKKGKSNTKEPLKN